MSLFGALKGKLHKKSLDQEIDEAFGEKEPFSKRVLDANKKHDDDPEYNRFAGRSADSFQSKSQANNSFLNPELKLQQQEEFAPLPQGRQPPTPPEPLAVRQQPTEEPSAASSQHNQLASKIQALRRQSMQPAETTAEPQIPASYTQQIEPQQHANPASSDLRAEIEELKEQNKTIISILRDIQKHLRI